jgi:hypothetical protein
MDTAFVLRKYHISDLQFRQFPTLLSKHPLSDLGTSPVLLSIQAVHRMKYAVCVQYFSHLELEMRSETVKHEANRRTLIVHGVCK